MKHKLNIAIFHLAFVYSGGGEKLVIEEAKRLKKRGHNVTIYTPSIKRKECFPDIVDDVLIKTFLPFVNIVFRNREQFQIALTSVLAPFFAFRFRKVDCIFAANQPSSWLAYFVKKMFGVPYVTYLAQPTRFLHPREIDRQTGLYFVKKNASSIVEKMMRLFFHFVDWADRISISDSDKVLANGEYVKGLIEKTYKVQADSCPAGASVPPTIKTSAQNMRINKKTFSKPYMLITNRHFAQKRFEYGIAAFSSVVDKFPDYKLVITGEFTDYTQEIMTFIARLSLEKSVIFLGYVNEKDLSRLYRNASIYLYTAPEEDFGMGVIEAMGAGVPIVAWKKAGPSFTVLDTKTGYLAKPFETSDFGEKIERIIESPKVREKMSKNAKSHVSENYSWDKHIDILESSLIKIS